MEKCQSSKLLGATSALSLYSLSHIMRFIVLPEMPRVIPFAETDKPPDCIYEYFYFMYHRETTQHFSEPVSMDEYTSDQRRRRWTEGR